MHEGHRQRLKKRFNNEGLDNFSEINMLELLLFFSVPRKDTNPISHRLLNKFGNIPNILEANFEELIAVEGITENSATLLKLTLDMCRYYYSYRTKPDLILNDINLAGQYLAKSYIGQVNEVVKLLALDSKGKLLGIYNLFEGNINSVQISTRKVVETALLSKAMSVILSHNHPGGIALPSEDDVKTTSEIKKALALVSVNLLDHIVVADNDFVSMTQSGMMVAT